MNSVAFKKLRAALSFCFHYIHKQFLWGIFKRIDEKFIKFLFVGFLNTAFSYFIYAVFITIGLCANLALFFQYIFLKNREAEMPLPGRYYWAET